jgi:hypothetical protein
MEGPPLRAQLASAVMAHLFAKKAREEAITCPSYAVGGGLTLFIVGAAFMGSSADVALRGVPRHHACRSQMSQFVALSALGEDWGVSGVYELHSDAEHPDSFRARCTGYFP